MKTMYIALFLTFTSLSSAHAAITSAERDRLRDASALLSSLRGTPDSGIPDDLWNRAACVAVMPSVKKAAFVFGGEYGKGVLTCRNGERWSAPAFIQLEKGSWGLQIGAQELDLVLLIMNRRGVDTLLQDKVAIGADAAAAAGPVGRTATVATDAQMSAEILSYSRSHGLFAGIDLSGGVLGPDNQANRDAYGPDVTARQIVGGSVKPPAAAHAFLATVQQFRPTATTGRKTSTGRK